MSEKTRNNFKKKEIFLLDYSFHENVAKQQFAIN